MTETAGSTGSLIEVAAGFDRDRLSRERLERARESLRDHGLAAALLFDPTNVRYVTSVGIAVVLNLHLTMRCALVPVDSDPVLWEYGDALHVAAERFEGEIRPFPEWTFFGSGTNSPRDARAFAAEIADVLRERGLLDGPIGMDRLETVAQLALVEAGLQIVDVQPAIEMARVIKTDDELLLMRRNAARCDRAIEVLRDAIRPGATENQIWAAFMGSAFAQGAEYSETRLLTSGPRTNPWMQEASHRVVEDGDLVAFDTDLVGEDGLLTDISRTYLCGDRPASDEQRSLYRAAYEFVQGNIPEFRAGRSFEELGELLTERYPKEYEALRYPFLAHGDGAADEYPAIKWSDHHPGELEVGMVISVEAYAGTEGGREGVKLEDQIIIGEDGPEVISHAPFDERLLA
jgi:Xaa-Pro aminopeptidase